MTELQPDARRRVLVHESHDARPRVAVRIGPEAWAPGRDPRIGGGTGHLGHDESCAAGRTSAQVHEVPIARRAVGMSAVLRHRRNDDAVGQRAAADRVRRQERRDRRRFVVARHRLAARVALRVARGVRRRERVTLRRTLREPALERCHIAGVALPQVLVRDPLRPRKQRIRELLRRQRGVAVDVLEPLSRVARGVLQLEDLHGTLGLVPLERTAAVLGRRSEAGIERDRVLERQLAARADREMRSVCRVAEQHERNFSVRGLQVVHPLCAGNARKADPLRRAAQVRGIAHEGGAREPVREQLLAVCDRLLAVHPVKAGALPHLLRCLDDEGAHALIELVRMGLEPAVLGLDEVEGEGVERARRAEPDVAATPEVGIRAKGARVAVADPAVDAVGGDHEIPCVGRDQGLEVYRSFVLEPEHHPERLAALLEDAEHRLASDAAEAMAARADGAAAEVGGDVVPVVQRTGDRVCARGIGSAQVRDRLVREDDAPAEGIVGAVAFLHLDVRVAVPPLEQQRRIESARTTPDDQHTHGIAPVDFAAMVRRNA